MTMTVMFTVTVDVPTQASRDDYQLVATAMAAKFIAENCQFDFAADIEIPDNSRVAVSFGSRVWPPRQAVTGRGNGVA